MLSNLLRFSIRLTTVTVVLMVATYYIDKYYPSFEAKPIYYFLYAYAWLLNVVYGIILFYSVENKSKKVNQILMLTSVFRIFGYLFFLVFYLLTDKTKVAEFIVVLGITYITFTIFDTVLASKILKNTSKK